MIPSDEILRAAVALKNEGTVIFPTETVYGLGASALSATAVAKVFDIKRRPRFNPLVVHIPALEALRDVALTIPESAETLARAFWPGPLTLVLPRHPSLPDIVTAELPTVAVRSPRHPVAHALLVEAGLPVAAPSANPFGSISPTRVEHLDEALRAGVDVVLDGGSCEVGVESTIIGFCEGRPVLLRAGGTPLEEIEAMVGPVRTALTTQSTERPMAPGMLERHYAPGTRLVLDGGRATPRGPRIGLLALGVPNDRKDFGAFESLSEREDLTEAAARLFESLRRLDHLHLDCIVARPVPSHGLGLAINDRLLRASR